MSICSSNTKTVTIPPSLEDFFALRDEFAKLLDRKVDLTMVGAVRNPYVLADIERSRQSLHGE